MITWGRTSTFMTMTTHVVKAGHGFDTHTAGYRTRTRHDLSLAPVTAGLTWCHHDIRITPTHRLATELGTWSTSQHDDNVPGSRLRLWASVFSVDDGRPTPSPGKSRC